MRVFMPISVVENVLKNVITTFQLPSVARKRLCLRSLISWVCSRLELRIFSLSHANKNYSFSWCALFLLVNIYQTFFYLLLWSEIPPNYPNVSWERIEHMQHCNLPGFFSPDSSEDFGRWGTCGGAWSFWWCRAPTDAAARCLWDAATVSLLGALLKL